jgi:hypothetical protein
MEAHGFGSGNVLITTDPDPGGLKSGTLTSGISLSFINRGLVDQ